MVHISALQSEVNRRWDQQTDNPCHKLADAGHALVHIFKAAGKLASALNDAEHEHRPMTKPEIAKYLANLVICATRMGNGIVDLDTAVAARLAEKFPRDVSRESR